jgi:hypothetical protein
MSDFRVTRCRYLTRFPQEGFLMKQVPLLLLVVTLLLSVGLTFAATPTKSAPEKRSTSALPAPAAPNVVLYDQYDNAGALAVSSQDYETAYDTIDSFVADDFVVPAGETWNIDEVDVQGFYFNGGPSPSFHVYFYQDAGGLPGTNVYTALAQPYSSDNNIGFQCSRAWTLFFQAEIGDCKIELCNQAIPHLGKIRATDGAQVALPGT